MLLLRPEHLLLCVTEPRGSLLSSRLSFCQIIPGASQAPDLFGFLRRETSLFLESYQKDPTQQMSVSSCLGPQTCRMFYEQYVHI